MGIWRGVWWGSVWGDDVGLSGGSGLVARWGFGLYRCLILRHSRSFVVILISLDGRR